MKTSISTRLPFSHKCENSNINTHTNHPRSSQRVFPMKTHHPPTILRGLFRFLTVETSISNRLSFSLKCENLTKSIQNQHIQHIHIHIQARNNRNFSPLPDNRSFSRRNDRFLFFLFFSLSFSPFSSLPLFFLIFSHFLSFLTYRKIIISNPSKRPKCPSLKYLSNAPKTRY